MQSLNVNSPTSTVVHSVEINANTKVLVVFQQRIFRLKHLQAAVSSITNLEATSDENILFLLEDKAADFRCVLSSRSSQYTPQASTVQDWLTRENNLMISSEGGPLRVIDLNTLISPNWLNNNVINKYMNLLTRASASSVHVFDTNFYQQAAGSYNNVKR
ncbi:uncharacterized protein LOC107045655 [Diachasma alloeum]|uniref:uncharacterized protein LOC107045655 n=1 Tax=Diachasma alloeum TaxID=454923 RepID=UPI00073826BE|nr:uncharacterized protein LOC107045655 [Diachasma alloeum]